MDGSVLAKHLAVRLSPRCCPPSAAASIPRVSRRPRQWDGVADVGEAGDVGKGAPGESRGEAEASVRNRAVAPEGLDLGQRQAVGLDVELPRDRQERPRGRRNPARNPPCVMSGPKAVVTLTVGSSRNPNEMSLLPVL
jgi:hypothetical protein